MLLFHLHMEFEPPAYDEAAAVLRTLVGPVRSERGCRATRLLTSEADECKLTWVEEWSGVEDFEGHLRGATFRRILAVIELAAKRPVIDIDDVASRRGFDLVEEVLGVSRPDGREIESGGDL